MQASAAAETHSLAEHVAAQIEGALRLRNLEAARAKQARAAADAALAHAQLQRLQRAGGAGRVAALGCCLLRANA